MWQQLSVHLCLTPGCHHSSGPRRRRRPQRAAGPLPAVGAPDCLLRPCHGAPHPLAPAAWAGQCDIYLLVIMLQMLGLIALVHPCIELQSEGHMYKARRHSCGMPRGWSYHSGACLSMNGCSDSRNTRLPAVATSATARPSPPPSPCQVAHGLCHASVAMICQLQERSGRGAGGLRCCPRAAVLLAASRLFMLFMNGNSGLSMRRVPLGYRSRGGNMYTACTLPGITVTEQRLPARCTAQRHHGTRQPRQCARLAARPASALQAGWLGAPARRCATAMVHAGAAGALPSGR